MFKRSTIIVLLLIALAFITGAGFAYAASPTAGEVSVSYTLIAPFGTTEFVDTTDANKYFDQLFVIFFSIITILAVIRLMICGIQYMVSESVSGKGNAKECLTMIIGSLLLIFLSFLILGQINPNLKELNFNHVRESINRGPLDTLIIPTVIENPLFCFDRQVLLPDSDGVLTAVQDCTNCRRAENECKKERLLYNIRGSVDRVLGSGCYEQKTDTNVNNCTPI